MVQKCIIFSLLGASVPAETLLNADWKSYAAEPIRSHITSYALDRLIYNTLAERYASEKRRFMLQLTHTIEDQSHSTYPVQGIFVPLDLPGLRILKQNIREDV